MAKVIEFDKGEMKFLKSKVVSLSFSCETFIQALDHFLATYLSSYH
jgi:hypothetical protein